ncbi:MAG TPA: hypothetical protein VGN69_09210 [Solirubrobacteraceae bacterium]|nr:hypothetical protein [Solirubrobacteraceae bacterium]
MSVGLGLTVLVAACRPASYTTPLERDTAQMLYGGEVVLHGGVPYVDAAVNKGPLTYLLFAVIRLLSGHSELVVRLTLVAFAVVSCVALAGYLRGRAGPAAGLLGGLTMGLLAALAPFSGEDPNLQQYLVAPLLVALWLTTVAGSPAAVAAGATTAIAGLVDPAYLPFAAVIGLALWWGACPAPAAAVPRHRGGSGVRAACGSVAVDSWGAGRHARAGPRDLASDADRLTRSCRAWWPASSWA